MPLVPAIVAAAGAAAGLRWLRSNQRASDGGPPPGQDGALGNIPGAGPVLAACRRLDAATTRPDVDRARQEARLSWWRWVATHPSPSRLHQIEQRLRAAGHSARRIAPSRTDGLAGDVLIVGRSGVGKSTLLNAVAGEDRAPTGVGRPVTDAVRTYPVRGGRLIDTPGLELGGRHLDGLRGLALLVDAAWICLPAEDGRVDPSELEVLRHVRSEVGTVVVATRVLDPNADLSWLQSLFIGEPVMTLARERAVAGHILPPHGITELLDATRRTVREYRA